jgi:hypothetical protein
MYQGNRLYCICSWSYERFQKAAARKNGGHVSIQTAKLTGAASGEEVLGTSDLGSTCNTIGVSQQAKLILFLKLSGSGVTCKNTPSNNYI